VNFEPMKPEAEPEPINENDQPMSEPTSASAGEAAAGPSSSLDASAEAKRLAAVILEVLAGTRGPSEGATLLGISLARYYQLETRALAGLVAGCEPRRRGIRKGPTELSTLRQECDRLRRECARQQALVRAAQRTVGLASPPPAPAPPPSSLGNAGRKRRKRRPRARALKAAALLRGQDASGPVEESAKGEGSSPKTS
jgi:hypothetical protein